jgi:predicted nucleotidyltransferase
MSGNVTQRGELAIMFKWARARAAIEYGADLVLELPAPYACSSADRFALGAVHLLNASGVVDTLSFGSESGDIRALERAADALEDLDIKSLMSGGISYPAALSSADEMLSGANNTLGIAYIKALRTLGSDIKPITVKRIGAGHDELSSGKEFPSAKELREKLFSGTSAEHFVDGAEELISPERHGRIVLAALRGMSLEQWSELEDVSEGLEFRLNAAVRNAGSIDELYALVKTKRYTMARIRRIILRAYLGIPKMNALPPYFRVLALNGTGAELLKRMKRKLPVITKPASYRELDAVCREFFEIEIEITDKIGLHCAEVASMGRELRESPVVVE